MAFGLNLLMLFGLAAVAIPPIIHLLNRRRYDVVHWGAMQFLKISEATRRRLLIEELLLMAMRMLLIAVLVIGLASPWILLSFLDRLGMQENRDVVIIIDGSASMSLREAGTSPHQQAQEWARDFIGKLRPGDSVAILQAQQQVIPVFPSPSIDSSTNATPTLTHALENADAALSELPPPAGSCDMPLAVDSAYQILAASHRPHQDVIILTDGQRKGFADESTKSRWRRLRQKAEPSEHTGLWVVNLQGERTAAPANWILGSVHSGRALALQRTSLESALRLHGEAYEPPHSLRVELDGAPAGNLPAPSPGDFRNGQIPLGFAKSLSPGSHLLSLIVEPDPPPEQRPQGYVIRDQVPADNRQDFAVMVRLLPVLLVDGGNQKPDKRGADLLQTALTSTTGPDDPTLVRPRLVTLNDFVPSMLTEPTGPEPDTKPRVVIFCDVPELTDQQEQAVTQFIDGGGHMLVTLGERAHRNKDYYNQRLYRRGEGWLPITLDDVQGDEFSVVSSDPAARDPAVHPRRSNYTHPALGLLRPESLVDLDRARFPRWWKLDEPPAASGAAVIARFDNDQPFLVERAFGKGGVILSAVPLDESWRTNLHRSITAATPFLHELFYHLIGARSAAFNLVPGRPLAYEPFDDEAPGSLTIQPPHGPKKDLVADHWPFIYSDTRVAGVYRLTSPAGKTVYYVVQPDTDDGDDLTPASDQDRKSVADIMPFAYSEDAQAILRGPGQPLQLWWWILVGFIALLCFEVWLTRRIAMNR